MEFRMLGLRIEPPGPFWFEDLMYFVIDESRRLPRRVAAAFARIRRLVEKAAELATTFDPTELLPATGAASSAPAVLHRAEVAPLDEPEAWALATEPLVVAGASANAAAACHKAAAEQLDSLTYVLARMRDDLRPIMTYRRLEDDNVAALPDRATLDTSIEALLELSRKYAASRPKDRVLTAA
jgi:hypothetical protein